MEFIDEQLDFCQQQEKQQFGSTITTQPRSLYDAFNLNKLLHIKGVRIYSDLWSEVRFFIQKFF